MRRPLIFVTPTTQRSGAEMQDHAISLGSRYLQALWDAGGMAVALPLLTDRARIAEVVAAADGLVISGGDDLAPERYWPDVPAHLRSTCDCAEPERDEMEMILIEEVFRARRPLLAICRGHQAVNVALGGTLYVDLPSERPTDIRHCQMERKYEVIHDVTVLPDAGMAALYGRPTLGVNSTHHQAIHRLAAPLRPTLISTDGLIEGTELRPEEAGRLPWFASVQFHPERLYDRLPEHARLFRGFVEACRSPK